MNLTPEKKKIEEECNLVNQVGKSKVMSEKLACYFPSCQAMFQTEHSAHAFGIETLSKLNCIFLDAIRATQHQQSKKHANYYATPSFQANELHRSFATKSEMSVWVFSIVF